MSSVAEIQSMPVDTWVSAFSGQITAARNRAVGDKQVSAAMLVDATGTVKVESWDHDLTKHNNQLVKFHGKGAVVKEYEGEKFVKLLRAAVLHDEGKATAESDPTDFPPAKNPAAAVRTLETVGRDYEEKLVEGYRVASRVEADLDGLVTMTNEDKRAIAISFTIEASKRGL